MKKLVIFVFLFLLVNIKLYCQVKFDSYFQIFKTQSEIKIYHTPMTILIDSSRLLISVRLVDGSQIVVLDRCVVFKRASDFFISQDRDMMVYYYPDQKKIWVVQNTGEQEFFGELPQVVNIKK